MHLDAVNVSSECFYVKHAFHVITRRAAGSDIASLITQLVVLAIYPPDFFRMGTAVPGYQHGSQMVLWKSSKEILHANPRRLACDLSTLHL